MSNLDVAAAPSKDDGPVVRRLGCVDYTRTWEDMRSFTAARDADTPDELWDVRHAPVYTLGLAGRASHVLRANGIPIVRCDRGGQVTYHGPGQVVVYTLFDLRRLGIGVREFVASIERAVIETLDGYGIDGRTRPGAPGVYVGDAKIASLGLRIRNGCSYHGVALNVDVDLSPFRDIDPCGFPGQAVTRIADLVHDSGGPDDVARRLTERLAGVVGALRENRSSS